MKVAVVMTVKNEERLLLQNILYHLGIGIECIFIYFDGTTDNGKEKVKGIPKVIIQDSVQVEKYKDRDYLDRFTSNAQDHHTARQCLNTYDALEQSKAAGIDWLISLDADELFITKNKGEQSLSEFFRENKDHDVIQFSTMEVIGRKIEYQHVMAEEILFKIQKNFKSKLDQIYRKIYNPYTKKHMIFSYWFGHTMGKAAINVKREIIPHNVHRYKSVSRNKLKLKKSGNILHYHLYDFEDFLKKYDNFKSRPATFLSGNKIESLKSLWIQLVNDPNYSKQFLKMYYEKYILYNSKEMKRLGRSRMFPFFKRKEKSIIEIEIPKKILKKLWIK